jgi:hypothetical protein
VESLGPQAGFSSRGGAASIPPLEQIFIPQGTGIRGRLVSWAGRKLFGFLLKKIVGKTPEPAGGADLDVSFALPVTREEAAGPMLKEISYLLDGRAESLRVKIPPEARDGMTLRLRGKGRRRGRNVGDLYLKMKLE